jgi:hypothetical protein
MTDADDERQLRLELMKMDIQLRRKQDIWEHPRNIAILVGASAALFGAIFGVLGYKLGQAPPQTINVHLDAPLTIAPQAPPK